MARLDRINALIDEFWEDGVFEERERRAVYRMGKKLLLSRRRIEALIEAGQHRAESREDEETRLHNALRNSIEFMLVSSDKSSNTSELESVFARWKDRKQSISAEKMALALGLKAGQLEELEDHLRLWTGHPDGSRLKLMAGYRLGACISRMEAKSRRNFKLIWTPTNPAPDAVRQLRKLIHDLEDMIRETLYELAGGKRGMSNWIAQHFPKESHRWMKNWGPHGILQELYFSDLFRILLHPAMRKDTERVFKKKDVLAFGGSVGRSLRIIGDDCNALRNKAAHGKELTHFDLPRLHLYYDAIVDQLNEARNREEIDVNTSSTRRNKRAHASPASPIKTRDRSPWKFVALFVLLLALLFEGWQNRHFFRIDTTGKPTVPAIDSLSQQTTADSLHRFDTIGPAGPQFNPWIETDRNDTVSGTDTHLKPNGEVDWKPVAEAEWDTVVILGEEGIARWKARCTNSQVERCRFLRPDGFWIEGLELSLVLEYTGYFEVLMEVQANGFSSTLTLPFEVIAPVNDTRDFDDPVKTTIDPSTSPPATSAETDPCDGSEWGTLGNEKTILMDESGWIRFLTSPDSKAPAKPDLIRTGTKVEVLIKKGKFRFVRTCSGQSGFVHKQQLRD